MKNICFLIMKFSQTAEFFLIRTVELVCSKPLFCLVNMVDFSFSNMHDAFAFYTVSFFVSSTRSIGYWPLNAMETIRLRQWIYFLQFLERVTHGLFTVWVTFATEKFQLVETLGLVFISSATEKSYLSLFSC